MEARQPAGERADSPLDALDSDASDFTDPLLREVVGAGGGPFHTPPVGERMGGQDGQRFEILEELGGGAMGRVFRAHDQELQRVVALKFLAPADPLLGSRDTLISQLRQEARMVAQLDHENIVRIFDVSGWKHPQQPLWVPFLVMECLEGESLVSLLRREPLELGRALDIMGAIAEGLAHAHERHVIHRDLKPSNVFLTRDGKVKLLDFGLAHLLARSSTRPSLADAGTPTHMAPEQWRGEAQDERTDVWAAGVTFFEVLTGSHPLPDADLLQLHERMQSSEPMPPVRERRPDVPADVERLVATALAKVPARRFASAVELREALRAVTSRLASWREAPAAGQVQRRPVTLVACRLTSLPGAPEELDPEDSGELEAAFHQACARRVHRHDGAVVSCIGGEVLACFGYPVAQEDSSVQAVRAGLHLARSLREELPPAVRERLAVQVGIHTDLVLVGDAAAQPRGAMPSMHGEAPQVAAWLAQLAPPGSAVMSEATHALVRGTFATGEPEPHTFQGLSGQCCLGVRRVLQETEARSRFERTLAAGRLTPLVGRERELGLLLELWEDAEASLGSFVLLGGEAGIGKSRLVQELRERLAPGSATWIRCQCWPQFSSSAFYPVTETLLRLLRLRPEDAPEQKRAQLEQRLGTLGTSSGDTRHIASLLGAAPSAAPLHLTPERAREETVFAVSGLLVRASAARPLLVAIEDVHWADPSTLQLLAFLLRRIGCARILVVLTARPEFEVPWQRHPWLRRVDLERLPPDLTAQLVHKAARGVSLPPETVEQLVAKTDGIPLFVEELTRSVVERASARASPAIPVTLHELLLSRLDLLPPRRKALAQVSAVVGRSFTQALLAELCGQDAGALGQDLHGLVEAGLLQPQDEGAEPRYQFRHALLQDAAYQSLPRSVRRQHHGRIAHVLADKFPDLVEGQPELLAHHYTEGGERERAIQSWARAGQRASQRSAHLEAVSHLTRALALLEQQPPSPERAQLELRLLMDLGIPLVETRGFAAPEVERTYARAWELIREVGEALPALELSHWGPFAYHFARGKFAQAEEVGQWLVVLGERQGNDEFLALGHRMRATVRFTLGEMSAALEQVEHAVASLRCDIARHRAIAVKHWVDPTVAALSYAGVVYAVRGEPARAQASCREALGLADQIGHPHTSAFTLTYTAITHQVLGDARGVVEWGDRALATATEHRFRLWQGWSTLVRSWGVAAAGQPEQGVEIMRASLPPWERSGIRAGLPYFLGMRAEMHLMVDQAHEALQFLEEGLRRGEETGERSYESELWRLRADALRRLGREAEATESLHAALRVATRQGAGAYTRRAQAMLGAAGPGEEGEPHAAG